MPSLSNFIDSVQGSPINSLIDGIYSIKPKNWFASQPYAFKFTNSSGQANFVFLPLSPSNINIVTHYATNVITTLYGIVEEHSPIRYYDITISGTTGYAPKYSDISPSPTPTVDPANPPGRKNFAHNSLLDTIAGAGFAQQTLGVIQQVAQQATDVVNLINGGDNNKTGVDINQTGYVAFHNLYRFFQVYKKDQSNKPLSASNSPKHPLQFINYKDNNQYDIVPMTFTLTRSAESPMLYNYNIVIRAFNLRSSNVNIAVTEEDLLNSLGLGDGGVQSLFNQIQGIAKGSMAVLGGAAAGVSVLGG